jgi:hypothetical protein
MIDAPLTKASGEPIYLTEAFIAQGGGDFVLLQAGANGGDHSGCKSIAIGDAAPLRDTAGYLPNATMRRTARPIYCAPMVMSRRASRSRRQQRCRLRWPAPAGGRHDALDHIEFHRSRHRLSDGGGSASRPRDEDSALLDTALVLILANHIGDADVLREAISLAKRQLSQNKTTSEKDAR